jgi:hypothetical protein
VRTTVRLGLTANGSNKPGVVRDFRRDLRSLLQKRGFVWVRDGFDRFDDITPEEVLLILNEVHALELGYAPAQVKSIAIQSRRTQVLIRRSNSVSI